MQNKHGFTLAEVLITLGIIGVVAALTIPILVNSYQKTQYVTGLKKAYSEFNQALVQMAADNNCVGDLKCTGFFDTDTTQESLGKELVKYFKVVKNCESRDGGPTITGCFSDSENPNYDGSGVIGTSFDNTVFYRFITSSGVNVSIINRQNNCDEFYSVSGPMLEYCGDVIFDINGLKGPNNWGRDIFMFYITNGKGPLLYPYGGSDDGNQGTWSSDGGTTPQMCFPGDPEGWPCAGRVMEEGWQMKY